MTDFRFINTITGLHLVWILLVSAVANLCNIDFIFIYLPSIFAFYYLIERVINRYTD